MAAALARTCASLDAFGSGSTPSWRSSHASAICAGVRWWRAATDTSAGSDNSRCCSLRSDSSGE